MAACLVCAACWAATAAAQQTALFTGEMGGEMVRLNAALKTYQNVPYVSLSQLTEQMGGKVRLEGPSVEISLGGARALAGINDTAVAAGQVRFALAHPVVTEYENAYISLDDAARFFEQGFQVSLSRSDRPVDGQAIAPSTPEEAPEETEDPKTLLKTLELAPPPAAPVTAPEEPSPTTPPVTTPPGPGTVAPAAAPAPQAAVPKGPIRHVALDAGHGGGDTGTMSPNGTAEKAVTAALVARFEKALAETGTLSAAPTRKEDREMSVSDRVAAAAAQSAGLLVSLHTGAALSPQAPLIQIYHAPIPAEGGDLAAAAARAKAVAKAMAKALAAGDDAPVVAVRTVPLRLQSAAKMPCLLVELGSLNQADGEAMLTAEEQRGALVDRMAKALAAAVADVNAQR
jgi:N-acetylmuramoyl-L-alanine amidase